MTTAVILVTGSRDWSDRDTIMNALKNTQLLLEQKSFTKFKLVHGACPSGADALADQIAKLWGWEIQPYPADWSQGKKAGPLRNEQMVKDAKPHAALAFRCNNSRGTTSCINCIKNYQNTLTSRLVCPVNIFDQ